MGVLFFPIIVLAHEASGKVIFDCTEHLESDEPIMYRLRPLQASLCSRMGHYPAWTYTRILKLYSIIQLSVPMTDGGDLYRSFKNSTITVLVCDSGCHASIAKLHNDIDASCGTSAELVPGMPFLELVDML